MEPPASFVREFCQWDRRPACPQRRLGLSGGAAPAEQARLASGVEWTSPTSRFTPRFALRAGGFVFHLAPVRDDTFRVQTPAVDARDGGGSAGARPEAGGPRLNWRELRAVIFDLDGVIVDSEPLHERAFREVFDELGYSQTHGVDFPAYYGKSDQALWLDFIAKHRPAQSLEELVALKQARFLKALRQERPVFAGLVALVEKLSVRYALAVASGSSHDTIDAALALEGLQRFFPVRVSALDVPHGKPAPDVFLRAAELLGVPPGACCVIEDAEAGVAGALAAGMPVIAITNSLPAARLRQATRVVNTYAQIERLLLGED